MANYRDVKGSSVVALAEGKKIGQIEELVVDPDARAVRWLKVSGGGGLFGGSSYWVRTDAVHSIGEHAVTINKQSDLRQSENATEAVQFVKSGRSLLGKKVLTEGGRYLGDTRDFAFNPDGFGLTSLIVSQGNAFSQQAAEIPAQSIMTIGEDLIVVSDGTEARQAAQAKTGRATQRPAVDEPSTQRPADRPANQEPVTPRPVDASFVPDDTRAVDDPAARSGSAQVYDS